MRSVTRRLWEAKALGFLLFAISLLSPLLGEAQDSLELVWNSVPGFSETEIQEIPSSTHFFQSVPLTLLRFRGSHWDEQGLRERIQRTEEIFSQCELSFNPIRVITVTSATIPVIDTDHPGDFLPYEDLLNKGAIATPFLILVDRFKGTNYDGGYSARESNVGKNSPIANTGALFSAYANAPSRSTPLSEDPVLGSYEVMAHELAHLLFDKPHLPGEGNILSVMRRRTNKIERFECLALHRQARDSRERSASTF